MSNLRYLAAAVALAALTPAAHAQTGGYLSLGGGMSRWNVDCAGTTTCDKSDSAVRLAGGWRFGGGFAVEGLYLGLGKARASVGTGVGLVNAELKGTAAGGGVALFLPLGANAELSTRLGVASVTAKTAGSLAGGPRVNTGDERKTKLYAGLGLGWSFSPTVQLQLHWDSTRVEAFDDEGQVSALTVGIGVRF
jgi:OmpA-OmpF porin, OOP family